RTSRDSSRTPPRCRGGASSFRRGEAKRSMTGMKLPDSLSGLEMLAYNLRWAWRRETRRLFRQLDPYLWQRTRQNPVQLLMEIDRGRLAAAARDEAYVARVRAAVDEMEHYVNGRETWY